MTYSMRHIQWGLTLEFLGSVVKQPTVGREATTNIKNNNINQSIKEQGRGVGEPNRGLKFRECLRARTSVCDLFISVLTRDSEHAQLEF